MDDENEAPPPPEEFEGAVPHLEWVLKRLRNERIGQEGLRLDLLDQLRICELMLMEAKVAEEAIASLLAGRVYEGNARVLRRWDGYESACWTTTQPSDSALEYHGRPPEPPPHVTPDPPQRKPTEVVAPAPKPWPAELAGPVCKSCGGPRTPGSAGQCRPCYLAAAAINRQEEENAEREADLPPPPWPKPELTDKQKKLFDCICNSAGPNWTVTISFGRLRDLTGLSLGSMSAHLYALEKKDMIRIVDHGNSTHPGTFAVCEAARPPRAVDPKIDEERRIAAMFARAH